MRKKQFVNWTMFAIKLVSSYKDIFLPNVNQSDLFCDFFLYLFVTFMLLLYEAILSVLTKSSCQDWFNFRCLIYWYQHHGGLYWKYCVKYVPVSNLTNTTIKGLKVVDVLSNIISTVRQVYCFTIWITAPWQVKTVLLCLPWCVWCYF